MRALQPWTLRPRQVFEADTVANHRLRRRQEPRSLPD
jgi:hypothetical protein